MNKLRTAHEIIDTYDTHRTDNFIYIYSINDVKAMIETAQREALEAAAENATTMDNGGYNGLDEWVINIAVDKSSILNLMNDENEAYCNTDKLSNEEQSQPSCLGDVSGSFSVGDKVIWDSHFGYDIAIFLGEVAAYEHWEIELHSGKFNGTDTMVSKSELHHYSKELIAKMSKQYGYEKDWSDVF